MKRSQSATLIRAGVLRRRAYQAAASQLLNLYPRCLDCEAREVAMVQGVLPDLDLGACPRCAIAFAFEFGRLHEGAFRDAVEAVPHVPKTVAASLVRAVPDDVLKQQAPFVRAWLLRHQPFDAWLVGAGTDGYIGVHDEGGDLRAEEQVFAGIVNGVVVRKPGDTKSITNTEIANAVRDERKRRETASARR